MKKILAFAAAALLLLSLGLSLASCSSVSQLSEKADNPIVFGKKYLSPGSYSGEGHNYYVFNRDGTGYYECKYSYVSEKYPSNNYTLSGRVEFVWREASDGAVYLFETETHYNADHTEGKDISLISGAIYFAEEFFTRTRSNTTVGETTSNYVLEGSELLTLIKD